LDKQFYLLLLLLLLLLLFSNDQLYSLIHLKHSF